MINQREVTETIDMITRENLDVRTITLGISLLDCIDSDLETLNHNIYSKITEKARNLVLVGREIEREYGIPIVNKRISVTPIALIGGSACETPEDYVTIAQTLDTAAKEVGVNFIGGFSALVSKCALWVRSYWRLPPLPKNRILWAARNWWYSVTRRMIILLWLEHSMA